MLLIMTPLGACHSSGAIFLLPPEIRAPHGDDYVASVARPQP